MASTVLAVLLEFPISVTFEIFTSIFDLRLRPIVTQQEGIISFKIGVYLMFRLNYRPHH